MTSRVVTMGEGLGIFRSRPGEELWQADDVQVSTGGAEANVAMSLARLGVDVSWIGRVGDDSLGRRVLRELRAEGVRVIATVDADHPTGLLVKETTPSGGTRVNYYRRGSAGSLLGDEEVDAVVLDADTLVHLTGITPALSETAKAATFRLLDRADAAGAQVSFDVNHRGRLWNAEDAGIVYRSIAARADIVVASLEEVPLLLPGWTGGDASVAAAELVANGHDHVVVTAGADGSAAIHNAQLSLQPAIPVRVVDSVGAGDAFVAGYLARFLTDGDIAAALQLGAVLGAAACRHPGDWEGAVDLSGLDGGVAADQVIR